MGYARVRHYRGGLEGWQDGGGALESGVPNGSSAQRPDRRARFRGAEWSGWFLDAVASHSFGWLLSLWVWTALGFGLLYWAGGRLFGRFLVEGGVPVPATAHGFLTALYFSVVTATSVGYGDVIPIGLARVLAAAESAAGLLIFGCLVSKVVTRRQEQLTEEIHRNTFEMRLGRVRTNLHLVLTELHTIGATCDSTGASDPGGPPDRRLLARIESAARVLEGEMKAVHDLLYRPYQVPEEEILEGILASVAGALEEFSELVKCLPGETGERPGFRATVSSISTLAREICSECVPRAYAPALTMWMDRIQTLSGGLDRRAAPSMA